MNHEENLSEVVFARLCRNVFFRGFVFQNPKYNEPTEKEAGDVVLWVRHKLIFFEVMWRNPKAAGSTKTFVSKIGEKRDQILDDLRVYGDKGIQIRMVDENARRVDYDQNWFLQSATSGLIIVDSDIPLVPAKYQTIKLAVDAPIPIAVLTRADFEHLLTEVNTVSDLAYYLQDRREFLRDVYDDDYRLFLQLGERLERELIGHYKLNNNRFDSDLWRHSSEKQFWHRYQIERGKGIISRDAHNAGSAALDKLTAHILDRNDAVNRTIEHVWELALLTRRERAFVAERLRTKLDALDETGRDQKFGMQNSHSGCWDVYYIHQGLDSGHFREEAQRMADRKMWLERADRQFEHSVFCFGFRYSPLSNAGIAEIVLTVSDAKNWQFITSEQTAEARQYFGGLTHSGSITEFPTREW